MNIRVSELNDVIKLSLKSKVLNNACVVYSMWLGYLEQDEQYKNFMDKMKELGIDVIYLHTSGHADYEAFKMLFDITKPKVAVPIHTEDKYKIKEFTQNATILEDGEILEI